MESPLVGSNLETHLLAAKSLRTFLTIFLMMDMVVLGEYAQVMWTLDPLATQLQVAEVCVTLCFTCDVCLALVALWLTRSPPRSNTWWASQYTVIKANYISNAISMVALAYCRLIQADGNMTLLLVAAVYILLRAAKLRPLARWYGRVAFAHDRPDEPISFEDLQSPWDPHKVAAVQKCLTRFTGLMLAIIVVGLGFAAWWDARHPPKNANNSTIISTIGGPTPPTLLAIDIVSCDSGMLSAAADGAGAGISAGAGMVIGYFWLCQCFPIGEVVFFPAVGAFAVLGGAIGVFAGIFGYIANCA